MLLSYFQFSSYVCTIFFLHFICLVVAVMAMMRTRRAMEGRLSPTRRGGEKRRRVGQKVLLVL